MLEAFKTFTVTGCADYFLKIVNYGYRACTPSFTPGYIPRKNHIIHYIYHGELIVQTEGATYSVYPGQAFISYPDHVYHYLSSKENPCTYRWIEFSGTNLDLFMQSVAFSFKNPIITDSEGSPLGNILTELTEGGKLSINQINGYSWFLADILSHTKRKKESVFEKYVEKAIEYIYSNIYKKTTVSDVAEYLDIDRSYLSRVFNQYMGISIKKYIYNCHMDVAKNMLTYSPLPIKDIAASVGYDDPLDFTKAFHRTFGASPSKWRSENKSLVSDK